MGLRAMLSSNESLYDAFLEAPLGEQPNGMTVSVFSALARFGIDPRREAERLAGLSDAAAAASLEGMIAQVSDGHWTGFDAKDVAKRAISLLPSLRAKVADQAESIRPREIWARAKPIWVQPVWVWIVVFVLMGAVFYTFVPSGNSSSDDPAFYASPPAAAPAP